jgi:hypothetical protein
VRKHGVESVLPAQYAMAIATNPRFAGGLPAGWDQRDWSVTRGAESHPRPTPAGTAAESKVTFRLGVRSVDLDLALRRADTALARRLTHEMIDMLPAVTYSESVAASYRGLESGLATDSASRSLERASAAERELRDLLDNAPPYAFGAWVAAADVAARIRDTTFFESPHGTAYIRASLPASALMPEDDALLRSIDARIPSAASDRGFDEIHEALQATIRRRGG